MLTDYGANLFADYLFGNRTMDDLPEIYFGLSCRPMGKAGFPDEPSNAGYRRAKMSNCYENFPRAINGIKSNANRITFGEIQGQCVVRGIFVSLVPNGNSKIVAVSNFDKPIAVSNREGFVLPGSFVFSIE